MNVFRQYQPFDPTDTDIFLCICVAFPVHFVSALYFPLQGSLLLDNYFWLLFSVSIISLLLCRDTPDFSLFWVLPSVTWCSLVNRCFVVDSWELFKYRLMSTVCPVFYFSMLSLPVYGHKFVLFLVYQFLYVIVHNLECCCSLWYKLYFFLLCAFVSDSLLLSLFLRRTTFHLLMVHIFLYCSFGLYFFPSIESGVQI